MAEKNPAAKAADPKTPRKLVVQTGRYQKDGTFVHNNGFGGERMGLGFKDGTCVTDDAVRAHSCLELGYRVLDQATGQDAWPKDEAKKPADEAAGSEPEKK